MAKRICIVTAGSLAGCPRMVKAADALHAAGYRVRVVSVSSVGWNQAAEVEMRRTRAWEWDPIRIDWRAGPWRRVWSGARQRAARALAGPRRSSVGTAAAAFSRVHADLARRASAEPADLFYGGTSGALAATAAAAARAGAPYALDLEDFHSAEQDDGPAARVAHALVERIERTVLPGAAFLTAGSPGIAEAYTGKYGVALPITLNNTFPLPSTAPERTARPSQGLRLYWCSQTLGPGRGLEDVVRALGEAGIPGQLDLRGEEIAGYLDELRDLARRVGSPARIVAHRPEAADPIDLCRGGGYDVGLALEQGRVLNRAICRTNKIFTYMLAGLAIAFTDTAGQRPLARDLGEGAIVYAPGDVKALAAGLRHWADDGSLLARAKAASWAAATRRWHWEHPEEQGALLAAVGKVLDG